ncbi:unnamed protein product [Ambrosiozyma monospora]|uniref:Unnamed protein product n=1 Tax=Ambrosiozyma monospora TaxID=43982 RepID=A0A9W6YXY2_AMBMO|nr:unnamed protein product [Ambrosiozyma monospora]
MEPEELQDEMVAIEAIYPDLSKRLAPLIYKFQVPQNEHITVQMSFPKDYPNEKPCILDVVSTKQGYDEAYLNELFGEVLDSIFHQGDVCVFDFFTELDAVLYNEDEAETPETEQDVNDHWNLSDTNKASQDLVQDLSAQLKDTSINCTHSTKEEPESEKSDEEIDDTDYTNYTYDEEKEKARAKSSKNSGQESLTTAIDPLKGWTISDPITDRKSTFVGLAKRVNTLDEAEDALELLYQDRKIARGNHVMRAWRIEDVNSGAKYQDCDDDGETAAGGRMLHLLTIMDAWNVMVVVVRWFGGTHIGPDRFKHINSRAREAVVKGGFVMVDTSGKKPKKKK